MDTPAKTPLPTAAAPAQGSSRRPPPRIVAERNAATTPEAVELERIVTRDGQVLILRGIDPRDVEALQRGFRALKPDEVRMRFLHPLNDLPHEMALGLCTLDPALAVALVLSDPSEMRDYEIHAVARAHIDPATLAAEFALVVQGRYAGQGFGTLLMQRLIAACRARGAVEMWGDVLFGNAPMLELCDHLGFHRQSQWQDPGVVRVSLDLRAHCAG